MTLSTPLIYRAHELRAIAQNDDTKRLTLISCCGEKLSRIAPARQLYRSQLFQKSALWADRQERDWFVISALYGLVKPDDPITPYDRTLSRMSPDEKADWGLHVAQTLNAQAIYWEVARFEITLLAGADYAVWIPHVEDWCTVHQPLAGMPIGRRLQWLNQQLGQGELALEAA